MTSHSHQVAWVKKADCGTWLKLMDNSFDITYRASRKLSHNEFMVIDANEVPVHLVVLCCA